MFKKIGIASLAVVAGLMIWHKTNVGSYLNFAWKKAKATANNSMPLEWEIERLRTDVANLGPDMRNQISGIAEEKVAIVRLQKEITVTKANLKDQEETIKQMSADLNSANEKTVYIKYNGGNYKVERVREKLARDWEAFKRCEQGLEEKEKLLEARQSSLDAALQKLVEMKSRKEKLEVQVAQLELKLKELRVAQTRNEFHVDDSQLSRCQGLLDDIQARIDAEATANELQGQFSTDQIPVGEKVKESKALEEINARFAATQSAKDDKK